MNSEIFFAAFVLSIPFCVYLIYLFIVSKKNIPAFHKTDIIYEERFASGYSEKNFLTKIGGASNCLRLIVTKDSLWITSWFPFSLLGAFYDLEHFVPLDKISNIENESKRIRLTYVDNDNFSHTIKILSRDTNGFLQVLKRKA